MSATNSVGGRRDGLSRTVIRCAIYTRKSSEEGLEQDFNSLDAQREACGAYIMSQRSEGWIVLPRMYDDGGFSGGTMERPALKALLTDIAAGLIDTVVVYKVDRLTRSLTDFGRIVDVFDNASVSFVSVTQSFNTTTSMGRLTLNMLLSFAQFEREVTGERIRDKIAASKAKGMWMGGRPPLGYTVRDRKLAIVPPEAEVVREIYRRYLVLGSIYELRDELAARNIRAKMHVSASGNQTGGGILDRGALYHLLQNRLYRGEITHRDRVYPGEHQAIVDEELWEKVQAKLRENRVNRQGGVNKIGVSLLAGLLVDEDGLGFTAVHANKKSRRYRYYVSRDLVNPTAPRLLKGSDNVDPNGSPASRRSETTPGPEMSRRLSVPRRLPATDIEAIVELAIVDKLADLSGIDRLISVHSSSITERKHVVEQLGALAKSWGETSASDKRLMICRLIQKVVISANDIRIVFDIEGMLRLGRGAERTDVTYRGDNLKSGMASDDQQNTASQCEVVIPSTLRRVGMEMRHIILGSQQEKQQKPDPSLLRTLSMAHRFKTKLIESNGSAVSELAEACGVTTTYFSRMVRLAFLSPEIVTDILQGRQPIDLSSIKLTLRTDLPISWTSQRKQLGFD